VKFITHCGEKPTPSTVSRKTIVAEPPAPDEAANWYELDGLPRLSILTNLGE
jgi:hypothetical protein